MGLFPVRYTVLGSVFLVFRGWPHTSRLPSVGLEVWLSGGFRAGGRAAEACRRPQLPWPLRGHWPYAQPRALARGDLAAAVAVRNLTSPVLVSLARCGRMFSSSGPERREVWVYPCPLTRLGVMRTLGILTSHAASGADLFVMF